MGSLVGAFAADVTACTLPQVAWIVASAKYSEHPEAAPAFGESLTARLLETLTASPEVWSKTVFILTYDENDGFFDHMPGPLPAIDRTMGISTVDTRGEAYQGQAVGLGVRVPLLIVSPWTRGGWVNSQVFDHTSILRFLERRFGVAEPNISPWRRAVTGDLTSMFDFAEPDAAAMHGFPATADALERVTASAKLPAPTVPLTQALPRQEVGQRPARALPYDLEVRAVNDGNPGLTLSFANRGSVSGVFSVYAEGGQAGPWFYTVEPGKVVTDRPSGLPAAVALAAHGPNGFLREFGGAAGPELRVDRTPARDAILITLINSTVDPYRIILRPLAYSKTPASEILLAAGARRTVRYPLASSDHWYDLVAEIPASGWRRRAAGHVETGRPSKSDPAIAS